MRFLILIILSLIISISKPSLAQANSIRANVSMSNYGVGISSDYITDLYDTNNWLLFMQFGATITSVDRKLANIGFGHRFIFNKSILGVNSFFDYDIKYKHAKLSFGAEYWTQSIRFSANYYLPMSKEKIILNSDRLLIFERPTSGWDFGAVLYLPRYPNFALTGVVEQWKQHAINNEKKHQFAWGIGFKWLPVSMFELFGDYRNIPGVRQEFRFGLTFLYQFGVTLNNQIESRYALAARNIQNARIDFVTRQINMNLRSAMFTVSLPEPEPGNQPQLVGPPVLGPPI
jgi:adhesin/invasin